MVENKKITEFRENELPSAMKEFWVKTENYVTSNLDKILDVIEEALSSVFEKTAEAQKLGMPDAGQITISFLRVTAWEEKQRAVIDVYDTNQIIGKVIYSQDLDISWLFTQWTELHNSLTELSSKKGVGMYVNAPAIRLMMEEGLRELAGYLYGILKYALIDADSMNNYSEIRRKEIFYISAGEYQDWQKIVYAEVPDEDITDAPPDAELFFQKKENQVYKGITFSDINLMGSRFTNCLFSHCVFKNVNLNDVRFIGCTFKEAEFESGTMYGAAFYRCGLYNTDMSGIRKEWTPFESKQTESNIYRKLQMVECEITEDGEREQI